ncbi:bifunctional metallophosphatase/5'-nucleotidase [Blastococcus sp. SYSU D00922]
MRRTRLSLAAAVAAATTVGLVAAPTTASAAPKPKDPVNVQLIAMNDFHGRIANTAGADSQQITAPGPDGVYGTPDDVVEIVGGSANVAATVERLQSSFAAQNSHKSGSYFVGAGDLVGATPFESAVFKDEPTIEILNAMGMDVSSVGNHEFDRGSEELRRISGATDGTYTDDVVACPETLEGEPFVVGTDGCFGNGEGHDFHGAEFPYLAANVLDRATGQPALPPYQVFDIPGGRKIALIGVVTETTPSIVDAAGIADVRVIDEAEAVNKWVPVLQRRGVEAIGVLVHEGGEQTGSQKANPNGCDTLTGPIVDINNRIANAVDLIVSAHTHSAYDCTLAVPGGQPRLVTSAGYYGRLVSDIRLTLDGRTGDVIRTGAAYGATNVPVTRTESDADVQAIVDYWVAKSAVTGSRVVGSATADIMNSASAQRPFEQPIGNLIAQAQLEALQSDVYGRPVIALMNPGGVRANILAGEVTYAEVFAVQPFGNYTGAMTVSGATLDNLLEQQYQQDPDGAAGPNNAGPRGTRLTFGTSEGFAWSYDLSKPYGERVPDNSITLNGVTIDPAANYRIAVNSFLAAGQDGFTEFRNGTNYVTGPVDVDALEAYIAANSPIGPPPANHGTQVG